MLNLELYETTDSSFVLFGTAYISSVLFSSFDGQLDVLIHGATNNKLIGHITGKSNYIIKESIPGLEYVKLF